MTLKITDWTKYSPIDYMNRKTTKGVTHGYR